MQKKYFIIFLLTATLSYCDVADYNKIKLLPPVFYSNLFTPSCREGLEKAIQKTNPKVIIELGSFLGGSAIFMGERTNNNCKIHCIDIWIANETWPVLDHIRPYFYEQFLSNIIHSKMQNKIIPIRMTTEEASKILDVKADIIYIDAAHWEEDVYNDIMNWYPKLAEGGVMCGDDYMWYHPSVEGFPVKKGVERAAKELGLKIKTTGKDNWFWEFVKE